MKKLFFNTVEEFVEDITERYDNIINKDEDISIVAKYEEARQIVKALILEGWNLRSIELHDVCYNNYDDEYIISLSSIDEDYEIWCEPMKRELEYISDVAIEIYVLDNCSSKVIPYCNGLRNFEVTIRELCKSMCEHDCCGRCDCYDNKESDGVHGFSVNHSYEDGYRNYSFYSTDKSLVNEFAKLFK